MLVSHGSMTPSPNPNAAHSKASITASLYDPGTKSSGTLTNVSCGSEMWCVSLSCVFRGAWHHRKEERKGNEREEELTVLEYQGSL